MKRIILRHLSGSKANQVDEFPLNHFQELTIGRDPSLTVHYDPDQDDLVGRQHAKIVPDTSDSNQFTIIDLNSRNGTYVNKQRIVSTAKIKPGDVVQFGPSGPEFQFDLEPRPENIARPTRVALDAAPPASILNSVKQTREGSTAPSMPVSTASPGPETRVGRTTVMRMIAQSKGESRKYLLAGAAGLAVVIVMVATGLTFISKKDASKLAGIIEQQQQQSGVKLTALESGLGKLEGGLTKVTERTSPLSAAEIAQRNIASVVWIEFSWKLIHTDTGNQVFHQYKAIKGKQGQEERVPLYVLSPDGKNYEPLLTLDPKGNKAIGGSTGGSGFVITSDGFILTNRHVAAAWHAPYSLPGGIVINEQGKVVGEVESGPQNWVPSEAVKNRRSLTGKSLEGRNDYLEVTFPANKLRIPAQLARVSDEHDVAMVKINLPEPLPKVELHDNYDQIAPGEAITVIGYPLASTLAPGVSLVRNQGGDSGPRNKVVFIPDPTVTSGIIGRVIKTGTDPLTYASLWGDTYQHTAATNGGNSGGPVFDQYGRVIAVHNAGVKSAQGANFAVPIKYGMDLMGTKAIKR